MANFDANSLRILEKIEDEFRNQYWIIRNSRRTNWRAVNRTRMLGDFMYMLGVPKWAVQQARYCLRLRQSGVLDFLPDLRGGAGLGMNT